MVSILFDLLSSEKSSTVPHKSWTKISSKLGIQGIKRSGILRRSAKMSRSLVFGKKEKFFYRKTEYLRTFSEKRSLETFDTRVLHIFEISAKFRFFWYPLCPILNSYKGRCCFFKVKSSNKIETVIYFKKTLFYKLVLGFQGQTKSHEAKGSRKITGPYSTVCFPV